MKTPKYRHYTEEQLNKILRLFSTPTPAYEAIAKSGLSVRLLDGVVRYLIKDGFLMVGQVIKSPIKRDIACWVRNPNPDVRPEPFRPAPTNAPAGIDRRDVRLIYETELVRLLPAQSIELALRLGLNLNTTNRIIQGLVLTNRVFKDKNEKDQTVTYWPRRVADKDMTPALKKAKTVKAPNPLPEFAKGPVAHPDVPHFVPAQVARVKHSKPGDTKLNDDDPPLVPPVPPERRVRITGWDNRNQHPGVNGIRTVWQDVFN